MAERRSAVADWVANKAADKAARLAAREAIAFAALGRAYAAGRILVFTDPKTVNKPGLPSYSEVDVFAPPMVLMVSSITLLFTFGMVQWIVAMSGVLGYQIFVQPKFVLWRAHRRARRTGFSALADFKELWDAGVLALAIADFPERTCIAPKGDWLAFAIDYFVDPDELAALDR